LRLPPTMAPSSMRNHSRLPSHPANVLPSKMRLPLPAGTSVVGLTGVAAFGGILHSPSCAGSKRMVCSGFPSRARIRAQNSHGESFCVIFSSRGFHPAFSVTLALSV